MKKLLSKLAVLFHRKQVVALRAAKNVRAGKKDSEPLRIAMRYYMLSWHGKYDSGEKRTNERHAEIERFYREFSEPQSELSLVRYARWLLSVLNEAGKAGMFYVPDEQTRAMAQKRGAHIFDESENYLQASSMLHLIIKGAQKPWVYYAVYGKEKSDC